MKKLKKNALNICSNKTYKIRKSDGEMRDLKIPANPIRNHTYSVMNGFCGFWEDGVLYVLPASEEVEKILQENQFSRQNFYVFFSQGETPLWAESQWKCITENKL